MSEWRTEFQYLLDRKMLTRDELGYLFGQIKSIIDREKADTPSPAVGQAKTLTRGCIVFMKASSGLVGYGNGQCVSSVCEPLGGIGLFGHNQQYKIHDIEKIAEYPIQLDKEAK